jgi:PAS domain S-box-containing protein
VPLSKSPLSPAVPRFGVPRGAGVPAEDWRARHRIVTVVLALHLPVLLVMGLLVGRGGLADTLVDVGIVAAMLAVALLRTSRIVRTVAATLGLLTCSALLVHLTGGLTEMHFHFFFALALLAVYEEWRVYALAGAYVLLHHGVMGTLMPRDVFGRPFDAGTAWKWALLHAGFIAATSAAQLVFWTYSERLRADEHSAAEALRASEAQIRQAFDDAPAALCLIDPKGTLLAANRAMCSMLALDPHATTGQSLISLAHPDERSMLTAAVRAAAAGQRVAQTERHFVSRDGADVWALSAVNQTRHDGADALLFQMLNVTGRRERSEVRMRLGLEVAGMAAWEMDVATGEVRREAATTELYGPEPLSSWEDTLRAIHADDRDAVQAAVDRAVRTGEVIQVEYRRPMPDGTTRWMSSLGQARIGVTGATILVGVSLDTTARHLADQERSRLIEARQQAADRAISVQEVTAALAQTLTVGEVRQVLGAAARDVLQATNDTVSLLERSDDGRHLLPPVAGADVVVQEGRPLLLATPHGYAERVGAQPVDGERSWALLPLHAAALVTGVWRLAWPRERVFDESERTLLATLAGLGGTALERARLYERQRGIAETLQRSLLPAELPAPAGVQVAAQYLPASAGAQVGGDWYDVVELPDGRVGISIGDVTGHGVEAAAVMGQLRSAVRAYALQGLPPEQVLTQLNGLVAALGGEQMATGLYLVLDPSTGEVCVASAGHPPVLAVPEQGRPYLLDVDPGLPLGVLDDVRFAQTQTRVPPGTALVAYTDGLIERRGQTLQWGLDRLVSAAARCGAAGNLGAELLAAAGPSTDDTALVTVRLAPLDGAASNKAASDEAASDEAASDDETAA